MVEVESTDILLEDNLEPSSLEIIIGKTGYTKEAGFALVLYIMIKIAEN